MKPERSQSSQTGYGRAAGRGSALLGVLVLGLVLSLVAGLGFRTVIAEIRLNRAFCDGVRAYYLAESGLVWGLSQARRALEEGRESPDLPQPPDNPFFPTYEEPHGFIVTELKVERADKGEGGRGQAGGPPAEIPAGGSGAATPREAHPAGQGASAAREENPAGGRGGATLPAEPATGGNGTSAAGGRPASEPGAGGPPSERRGGEVRKYRVTLTAEGWYGEGRRAVRRMEAQLTVTLKQDGNFGWQVEYWRQI